MSERTSRQDQRPLRKFIEQSKRPLTAGQIESNMAVLKKAAKRLARRNIALALIRAAREEQGQVIDSKQDTNKKPRKGSYVRPEIARWQYPWKGGVLKGAQGFLAECLEPSGFPQGSVMVSAELIGLIYTPNAPIPKDAFGALVRRTRAQLKKGRETLTSITPWGIKGAETSFYFRERLDDQIRRGLGQGLHPRSNQAHLAGVFKTPEGKVAAGRRAKMLTRLTEEGSMGRDALIRYLWDIQVGGDVRPYLGAFRALVGKTNHGFLEGSNIQVSFREMPRGPRGFKTPAEYFIGSKPVRKKESGGVLQTARPTDLFEDGSAGEETGKNELAIILPVEAKDLNPEKWIEIQTIIARSPSIVREEDIKRLAAIFGLNPGGNHLRTRLMPFIGGEMIKRTRGVLSWEARFDMYKEVKNRVKGQITPQAQEATDPSVLALPKPNIASETESIELPSDLEIVIAIGTIFQSLPTEFRGEIAGDLGFAKALLGQMTEALRSEYILKARESLYQSLDPYHMGSLLNHHKTSDFYQELVKWAYKNRELFGGQV